MIRTASDQTSDQTSDLAAGRRSQSGLTLTELLIALLVFAMISSAGVYALRQAVEGREQLEIADDRIREWQIARAVIKDDLSQIALRTVRDEFGDFQSGPFIGGLGFQNRRPVAGEDPLGAFVRRGWPNPDARSPRATLQYVEYVRKNDTLVRRVRPYLDDAPGQPRADRVLFSDVVNVSLTFFAGETNRGLQWTDLWPDPTASGAAPRAVRLVLETARFGEVEQLFWIGDVSAGGVAAGGS